MSKGEEEKKSKGNFRFSPRLLCSFASLLVLTLFSLVFLTACSELEKPVTEPFYSQTAPPEKKEFRWSNGRMPKSFDPALASSPPETDVVRAIFEGLTDTNPKTLETIPAVAEKWTASSDFKTWTFHLRKDARWSNGERMTANDFVRSWRRLADLGDRVAHRKLLRNIVGMQLLEKKNVQEITGEQIDIMPSPALEPTIPFLKPAEPASPQKIVPKLPESKSIEINPPVRKDPPFGVEAVDNLTLKVTLVNPDKNFSALVAHPIFRPIYGDGKDFEDGKLNASIVTSGAFRIFSIGQDGVTLDRAEYFWNKEKIELERVRFVPTENAEKALEAYRAGLIDAITNIEFEPLALKLLTPYDDFRRTTHSAINFYEFNRRNKPFDDRRVREALAIAIERERLTEGEMEGATKPALSLLPFDKNENKLTQDAERARTLLAEAGYPNGENFPTVNLVVNRNDLQQRIARVVTKMWKQTLNINAEIHVKESTEIETARETGDFDVIRRGEVLPTADETADLLAIFGTSADETPVSVASEKTTSGETIENSETAAAEQAKTTESGAEQEKENAAAEPSTQAFQNETILTEEDALGELPAIPLYFPTSYSLVKPYILGFEINTLDAPSLKEVRIDNNWQPKKPKGES